MIALLLAIGLLACGSPRTGPEAGGAGPRLPVSATPTVVAGPLVVFLGDSLTAGPGLGLEQTYPSLVAGLLATRGLPIRVVNAGVSGDTTAGGLARLDWLLRQRPEVLVVGLGANDGLRGLAARTRWSPTSGESS